MLEHEPLPSKRSEPYFVPVPIAEMSAADTLREDYLDRIFSPLVHAMPFAERQEARNEMRQHLDAHIAALEELGSTPEAAVREALQQFGRPEVLRKQWQQASLETGTAKYSLRQTIRTALISGMVGYLLPTLSILLGIAVFNGIRINNLPLVYLVVGTAYSLPLLWAFWYGTHTRRHSIGGAMVSQAVLMPTAMVLGTVIGAAFGIYNHLAETPWQIAGSAIAHFAYQIPVCGIFAGIGTLWRQNRWRFALFG